MEKRVILTLLLVWMTFFLTSCHARYPSDIKPGMTKEDVRRVWGGTYLITHQIREGREVEIWDYRFANTGAICRIVFYQDRVTTTQCWHRAPGPWWY